MNAWIKVGLVALGLILLSQNLVMVTLLVMRDPVGPALEEARANGNLPAIEQAAMTNQPSDLEVRQRRLERENLMLRQRLGELRSERDRLSRDVLHMALGQLLHRVATTAATSPGLARFAGRGEGGMGASGAEPWDALLDADSLSFLDDRLDKYTGGPSLLGEADRISALIDEQLGGLGDRFQEPGEIGVRIGEGLEERLDELLQFDRPGGLGGGFRGGFSGGAEDFLSALRERSDLAGAGRIGLGDREWRDLLRSDDEERTRQRRLLFTLLAVSSLSSAEEYSDK